MRIPLCPERGRGHAVSDRLISRPLRAGALAAVVLSSLALAATFPEADVVAFTDRHCSSCHNDVDREGRLDLTSLKFAPEDRDNFATWVKIHDRVQAGEMPPKEKRRPDGSDIASFMKAVGT